MRKLDLFWISNREWWEFRNHIPSLKENCPPEAKASYMRYLEQCGVCCQTHSEEYVELEQE